MKKITTVSLIVFVIVLVAIFVMWFGNMQKNTVTNTTNNNQNPQLQTTAKPALLDMQEVAKHNLATNCWTVVEGKVYNVTSFASIHSGGDAAILYNCGKDGTVAFQTKGGKGQHKSGDLDILANYLVGDLVTDTGK